MHRFIHLLFTLVLLMTAGLFSQPASAAPPEPQPIELPCATNVQAQVFGRTAPANADGQALLLVRVILAPGGSFGPHTHPGTVVASIESGAFGFTLRDHGEMTVMRAQADGSPAVAEQITMDQEVELAPGDLFVETGMVHSARNLADEPTTVLLTALIEDGQPLTICEEE